jgi:predicted PurR-regulated permease PerM
MMASDISRRQVSITVIAILLLALFALAPDVVLVIFAGILFAVFLGGGGEWIAARTGLGRRTGIGLFILAILLTLTATVLAFAPEMANQFEELSAELPAAFASLRERIAAYSWGEPLLRSLSPSRVLASADGTSPAATAVTSTFGALGNFVIMLFIGIYGALDPVTYRRGLLALLAPSLRSRADAMISRSGQTLRNWLSAQFLSMSVVGVLTFAGLWLIGLPLAAALALISALLTFIPNIGPLIAAVPALLLAFASGGNMVLLVIAVYVVVQAIETYLVTPLIQQEKVSLPPALVIGAQLVMGVMFGILGLALATPLAALTLTLASGLYVHDYLEREARADPVPRPKMS